MEFPELVRLTRSVRRFLPGYPMTRNDLARLVDLVRLSASAANLQPLRFILSHTAERNRQIFDCLAWAGYLKEWPGPEEGERPAGYIVILGDRRITENFGCDHGIAAQTIMLGARAAGWGGCILGAINRERLRSDLDIGEAYEILLVVALGKPAETVRITEIPEDGSVRYWRDADGVHHVPKRSLNDLILED